MIEQMHQTSSRTAHLNPPAAPPLPSVKGEERKIRIIVVGLLSQDSPHAAVTGLFCSEWAGRGAELGLYYILLRCSGLGFFLFPYGSGGRPNHTHSKHTAFGLLSVRKNGPKPSTVFVNGPTKNRRNRAVVPVVGSRRTGRRSID